MASIAMSAPAARAEIVNRSESGFVVRLASEVTAPPAEAWKTILTPAQWWQSQHTFSGDSANLTLDPQVGGCFCEVLPRPDGAPVTQKPGGVQHMRVIYIEPPRALRLAGALGPLQSEALAATMTITVKPTEKGSRILFEYVVGGFMRYKVDEIAPAVDRMLTAQLTSLSAKLGPVAEPAPKPAVEGGTATTTEEPAPAVVPLKGAESFSLPPKGGKLAPKPAAKPKPEPEPKPDAAPVPPKAAAAPASTDKAPAKAPIKAAYMAPAKSAATAPTKTATKAAPKPAKKPAPKAPDPEADAHRDANTAFDAALGSKPNP
ncbi:SRPBCC family protein [Novosphingobium sediminis]|nr:SRPBCC domain-containing protein [Novosphingobium sediminis]